MSFICIYLLLISVSIELNILFISHKGLSCAETNVLKPRLVYIAKTKMGVFLLLSLSLGFTFEE